MHSTPSRDPALAHLQQRIAAFDNCEFARLLGITIAEAREGYARVLMPSAGKNNPNDVIHGGAIFTLADQAFAIAANAGTAKRVAVSAHIQYLAPASGDLEAVAEYVGGSRRYSTYRVTVFDGERMVATFDGTAIQISP
ncbi:MAG: Thioesterase superfamily protein [Methanoregula sp. PtaU1.Bin051]|nr:MAG: Thioesterase superfamily protein [Methanoregula sp. PtaU1.Bin051]